MGRIMSLGGIYETWGDSGATDREKKIASHGVLVCHCTALRKVLAVKGIDILRQTQALVIQCGEQL